MSILLIELANIRCNYTKIYAEDEDNNRLQCEVQVATVESLQLLTNFRVLHVDDNEMVSLQAFDSEGNVFSSLEGLRFKWTAHPPGIVEVMPLTKSAVQVSSIRRDIENTGFLTDIVQLAGLSTGVVSVSVKLHEPGYENLPPAVVSMHVS